MSDKPDRKRKVRELRDADERLRAIATPRDPRDDISYPGIGRRVVGLLVIPSFEPIEAWDIRSVSPSASDFAVYVSRSAKPVDPSPRMLLGYDRLDTSRVDVARLVARLAAIRLPIAVADPDPLMVALDGTGYEIVLGSFLATVRLAWRQDGPEGWRPLTTLADEMLTAFRSLTPLS